MNKEPVTDPTKKPAVSVVMPVYNAAETVRRAIESIRAQTFEDWELIAVDDGSNDDTAPVLDRVAASEPRMHVHHQTHAGVAAAANAGLTCARGVLIARMDADDISHPERLEKQYKLMRREPELDLIGTRVTFGGDRRKAAGFAAHVDWTNTLLDDVEIRRNRFIESPLAHPSVMFRSQALARYGPYIDSDVPEDYELILRWLYLGAQTRKLPEHLVTWNDPPTRLSRNDPRYSIAAFQRCKAKYLARWSAAHNPFHPEIVIWGAGRTTRKRADWLVKEGLSIRAYIDIDPRKIGQNINGKPVWNADALPAPGDCFVISFVGTRGARDDIRQRLIHAGYTEEIDFLMAA